MSFTLALSLLLPPLAGAEASGTSAAWPAPVAEEKTAPSRLAPLAVDSRWRPYFERAADDLLAALRSRDERRWGPLLGGIWLSKNDRLRVAALLDDPEGVFAPLMTDDAPIRRHILGWAPPAAYSPAERSELAAGPEAEALICWSAGGDARPAVAAQADNAPGRGYACARIAYSLREDMPRWRAFIDGPGIGPA
ncbi:hypothetical protein [Sphingopyxis sp. MWB1]|uniref:hypothetical protein n=1 Tax=Sphingopyxis sp. MWB1 TaxID=1537715 RepID=UPI00051A1035|nr:hypothetical protein [Sphingopyxis sp. MWB1]